MPKTKIVLFQESDGSVPFLEWFVELKQRKAKVKCRAAIENLSEKGHALRRPHSDTLRDGIRELRIHDHHVHYRILYFFFGQNFVVISHGTVKEGKVPDVEIDRAVNRMRLFKSNPKKYTYEEMPDSDEKTEEPEKNI